MNPTFETSWDRAWQGLAAEGDGRQVRDAVLARYAEPHRRYHTLQHLEECLTLFDQVRSASDRPEEVEVALWFHDALYELRSSSNEGQSAAWALTELQAARVSDDRAARVRDLILATRHAELPTTSDSQVLLDVDLSILGASPSRFAEYERQIREEYSYVPTFLFRIKRRLILQSFLDRQAIFSTPVLHRALEVQARSNLAGAIQGNAA